MELKNTDLTILTLRGGVDWKGPGRLGKARWRDRVIWDGRVQGFGRGGRVWRRQQNKSRKEMPRGGRRGELLKKQKKTRKKRKNNNKKTVQINRLNGEIARIEGWVHAEWQS